MKPSIVPSNLIGKLIPNIPQYKITLWEAMQTGKKFREYKKNDEINKLTEAIGVWSAYVGYKAEENELILINKFIRDSFPTLNIEDVKECVKAVGDGRIKTEYHGNFAPLYVGKVLGEFKRIRSELFNEIRIKVNEHNKLLPTPKPSPEESLQLWKEILSSAHLEAVKGIFVDTGSLMYNFMLKNKLIDFSEKNVKLAEEYAQKQITMRRKKSAYASVMNNTPFNKKSKDYEIKLLKREFVINQWLRKQSPKQFKKFIEELTVKMI